MASRPPDEGSGVGVRRLARVAGLAVGDVLPLSLATLDRVSVEGLDGRRLAEGKLGQNREAPDREGAQHALQLRGHTALADAMRQASEPRQDS